MKRSKIWRVLGLALIVLVVLIASAFSYITYCLPNVGEAPKLKITATPQLIARGNYLANHVMACMDCHSTRDFTQFAGPALAGTLGKGGDVFSQEMGFPGSFYASNITPAALKNWTDGEIFRTITTGVTKSGKAIFPVMPYHNYGLLDSADVVAVIAYLRTIPAIPNMVPESKADFPMSLILHTIPVKAHLQPKPDTTDAVKYGRYLITAAACIDCHSQVDKGKILKGMEFAGGRKFKLQSGTISSANLTPDQDSGLGRVTEQDFVSRFTRYRDTTKRKLLNETEFNSIMPWTTYAGMNDADLHAIYKYLQTLKPVKNQVIKFIPKGVEPAS